MRRVFKQKGNKIVMKTSIEDEEMDSKQVLQAVKGCRQNVDKLVKDLQNAKDNIPKIEQNLKDWKEEFAKIVKFEEWANEVQVSKLKNIIEEIVGVVKEESIKGYLFDKGMSDKDNGIQLFAQFRQRIFTHPRIVFEIEQDVVKRFVFVDRLLVNPF